MNTQKKNNSTSKRENAFSKDPLWLYLLGINGLIFLLVESREGYLLASILVLFSLVSIYFLYLGDNYHLHHKVFNQLGKFSGEYKIFSNIELCLGEKKGYSDYLIISPKGIFNIRIIDFEGTISGYENDELWSYVKVVSTYDIINKKIKNPLDFLKRTHFLIEELMEMNYIKYIPIQSIIVINNSDATFETNSNIPVVKVKDLYHFINEYQDRANMNSILNEVHTIIANTVPSHYFNSYSTE